jgi:hypothetical protein
MSPAERSDPPECCHPAECCHPENIRQGCSQDLPVRTCPILQVEILRLLARAGIISPVLANCALDGLERLLREKYPAEKRLKALRMTAHLYFYSPPR